MGKTFLVTSGKGGVGNTTLACDLAATYAKKGLSTVLIDLVPGARNVDLYMGLENDIVYDMSDVINGVCDLEQALIKDDRFRDLSILEPAQDHDSLMSSEKLKVLFGLVSSQADIVIIDAKPGLDGYMNVAAEVADKIILTTMPEYASIRSTDALYRKFSDENKAKCVVVIDRLIAELMTQGVIPKLREIAAQLTPDVVGVIQEDKVINVSTNLGVPVIMKEGTYIEKNFEKLADALWD